MEPQPGGSFGLARMGRGFTLVEILVVIAIILILAAMLMPVFEIATKKAESISCLSQIRNLALAASMYADEYDGRIVPARVSGAPAGYFGIGWPILLQSYLRNEKILICPADPKPTIAAGTYGLECSYGINYDLAMVGGYNNSSLRRSDITSEESCILFMEIVSRQRHLSMSYALHGFSRLATRHRGGSNYAFCDGHTKWLRPQQTIEPENLWDP